MPLAIDLFCGLGGWSDGLLAEGYDVIGFDIERHRYPMRAVPLSDGVKAHGVKLGANRVRGGESRNGSFNGATNAALREAPLTGGWAEYPGHLVIQDVCTIRGSQFKNATLIVASPPCQEYSYMAMPWSIGKAKAKAIREDATGEKLTALNRLFNECFRIQKEASFAAGRHIPMVVENVRGAIPWVGRSRWNYGSFHLWGDVPALMPVGFRPSKMPGRSLSKGLSEEARWGPNHASPDHADASEYGHGIKAPGMDWNDRTKRGQDFTRLAGNHAGMKVLSESGRRADLGNGARFTSRDCGTEGIKQGGDWFSASQPSMSRLYSSKSPKRKMASAMIAKIPLPLSRHIAATFR